MPRRSERISSRILKERMGRVTKRYSRPQAKSPSTSSSSSPSSSSSSSPIKSHPTSSTNFANMVIDTLMRFQSLSQMDVANIKSWLNINIILRNIVHKVVVNKNPDIETLHSFSIAVTRPTIIPELQNAIMNYILTWLAGLHHCAINNDKDRYLERSSGLLSDKMNIEKVLNNHSVVDFDIERDINIRIRDATSRYWDAICNQEHIVGHSIYNSFRLMRPDHVNADTMEYIKDLWEITAPLFITNDQMERSLFHYEPIRPAPLSYGYLSYRYKGSNISHIFSYIVDRTNSTIEILDTADYESRKYNEYLLYLRAIYRLNYRMSPLNIYAQDLQRFARKYVDVYCLTWSVIMIYYRLIRGLSLEQLRNLLFNRLMITARQPAPEASDTDAIEKYNDALRFETGLTSEVKVFILRAIKLIEPDTEKRRRWFYANILASNKDTKIYQYAMRKISQLDVDIF